MSINGDKGSNYNFGNDLEVAKPQTSGFNLSYVNSFTAECGKLYPVFYEYTVNGDQGTISQENLVRVLNTPVVPLASRQRVFYHTYMSSLGSLWAETETFFTKGRTIADAKSLSSKAVPTVSLKASAFERGKLMDMLGFVNLDSTANTRYSVPIFKPMMYLRLWRDNYCNQRIFATWLEWKKDDDTDTSNVDYGFIKDWMFPADDHEFRWNSKIFDNWFNDTDISDTVKNATFDFLFGDLLYRYWTDDYFTTAQLSPIYGDVPYFAATLEGTFKNLVESDVATQYSRNIVIGTAGGKSYLTTGSASASSGFSTNGFDTNAAHQNLRAGVENGQFVTKYLESGSWRGSTSSGISTSIGNSTVTGGTSDFATALSNTVKVVGSTDMTLDSLRNLACATAIMQKLAHTDGSYGQYHLTYFGHKPKLAQDMKAQYIGGSYQPIVFNEVVNVANNQGDISGRGLSVGKDTLGHYFSDDYCILMTVMSIMPDTYYSQGWHKQDLFTVSDDFYLPERANLGMEAILNQEIFYKPEGYEVNPVFGYQQRCDYMRYRYNEVHGKVADPNNESYSPYIEQRVFSECPTLTPSFLSTQGTIEGKWRTDKTDGVSYFVQVLNTHRCTRPLPYKASPNNLGF